MKYTKKDRQVQIRDKSYGVDGKMRVETIFSQHPNARLFADVSLEAGSALEYHEHNGESEIYYILQGEGEYSDNENVYPVFEGDVTVCESGNGHSIKNTGKTPLRFIALILKS